ncbi:MAG: 4Fe-4S dicluster domain-containing protein [Candidatus Bathyarchaeia archaeon]
MGRVVADSRVCTGCRYCEIVCSLFHEKLVNPKKARIRVISDILKGADTPKVCHQCANPPCMKACQQGAIKFDDVLKIPIVVEDKCIGCKACVEACPFGEMFFDEERKVALKCDLCQGDPQCIKFCRALPHIGRAALSYVNK